MLTISQQINVCYKILEKYDLNLVDTLHKELIQIGSTAALFDGEIDKAELNTINDTFVTMHTYESLKKICEEECFNENGNVGRVPEVIKAVAEAEKKEQMGMAATLYDTREIYNTFKQFGLIIINCNGARLSREVKLLNRYLDVITEYIIEMENKEEKIEAKPTMDRNRNFSINDIDSMDSMKKILAEIDGMIGLTEVKEEIRSLVNLLVVRKMREERGYEQPFQSMHMVFTGNPGTGKTTIARKLADIYKCLGVLETGQLIETDRSGLVAGYVGQTAEKVNAIANKAMGGILFIDEAYALTDSKMEGDFGQEAVDTLLKIMEDNRDKLIVIVAGYPEPMEEFLDSNPGLRSRFNKYISFKDYTAQELYDIFKQMCDKNDYKYGEDVKEKVLSDINGMLSDKGENFANAREIRNYFEKIVSNQANRIVSLGSGDVDDLLTITVEDIAE